MSHLVFYFYNSGTIPEKEGEEECKVRKTKNKVCVFFCRKSLQFSGKIWEVFRFGLIYFITFNYKTLQRIGAGAEVDHLG